MSKRAKYVCEGCVGTGDESISVPGEEVPVEMTEKAGEALAINEEDTVREMIENAAKLLKSLVTNNIDRVLQWRK